MYRFAKAAVSVTGKNGFICLHKYIGAPMFFQNPFFDITLQHVRPSYAFAK